MPKKNALPVPHGPKGRRCPHHGPRGRRCPHVSGPISKRAHIYQCRPLLSTTSFVAQLRIFCDKLPPLMRRRIREGQKTACAAALRLVAVGILSAGCASSPSQEIMIHESNKGTVYLERFPDRSIQAAHPIKLDSSLITRVLRGVQVQGLQGTVEKLFASQPKAVRAFSDEDTEFLAPLLATAFSQAASDQQVGFQLTYPATGRSLSRGVG